MPEIPPDRRILYFGRDRDAFRFLSHFWPALIVIDGEEGPTVEHYYQAQNQRIEVTVKRSARLRLLEWQKG